MKHHEVNMLSGSIVKGLLTMTMLLFYFPEITRLKNQQPAATCTEHSEL